MSEFKVKDGDGTDKYLGSIGTGVTGNAYHNIPADFYTEVAKGNVVGHSLVHKFGRNPLVGTSYVPICSTGLYNTPQVAGATTLRIKAGGDVNDDAAGTGAREITIQGLDETGAEVTEVIVTNGASASLTTTSTFVRWYRGFVSGSGTYADQSTGSMADTITIENGAGGTDWGTIDKNGFVSSQTYIGAYTIPLGKTGYMLSGKLRLDTTKIVDAIFFKRENILQTAPPYSAMKAQLEATGLDTFGYAFKPKSLGTEIPALSDIGFMAKVDTGTADVSIEMEILLVDD